jgi:hypothetical protein
MFKSILLLFAVVSFRCPAQLVVQMPDPVPNVAIKFSPFHLLSFYPTLQISVEKRVVGNHTVQAEIGYVMDYDKVEDERYANKRGAKLKAEYRYYLLNSTNGANVSYLSAEPYANIINFDRTASWRECYGSDCSTMFVRQMNFKVRYREQGISLKAGRMLFIERLFFDLNAGVTLRFVDYKKPAIVQEDGEWSWINEDKRRAFAPVIGVRLGYRIR